MTGSIRSVATITLGISIAGYFIAYPFHETLLGGLLTSGFGAAVVGGLADWFAVTALFRKPLGIPFHTALIPRNREKIFRAIVKLVENDLLTQESIIAQIQRRSPSKLLLDYLEQHGGLLKTKKVLHRVMLDILKKIDPEETGKWMAPVVEKYMDSIRVVPAISDAIEWSIRNGYDDKLVLFVLDELGRLAKHPQIYLILKALLQETRDKYEQDMARRKVVDWLLARSGGYSTGKLAALAQRKIGDFLTQLHNPEHSLRYLLKSRVILLLTYLRQDPVYQAKLEEWKEQSISQTDWQDYISKFISRLQQNSRPSETADWLQIFDNQVERLIENFRSDYGKQERFDRYTKEKLAGIVDAYHYQIGRTVREKLEQFSDEMLVNFMEDKVGNDLQMVRINGSVVGSVVGMLIYLAIIWL
ncbi:DUF445 domain-containing protein [Lucifera butyrica]|nr:DUF445 domain-containing protein [Lucifera butyrica]